MKILKIGLLILIFLAGVSSGYLLLQIKPRSEFKIPVVKETARPLDKYTIENLSKRKPAGGEVKIEKTLEENKDFVSYLFSFTTEGKKVTGQMNVPVLSLKYPLILMIRGYVDQKIYQTGVGTKRPAEVFAKNGFITIAPDFLGYGDSNKEASDIFETRFQTYTTVLDLIESIKQPHFAEVNDPEAQTRRATRGAWNQKDIFLWAHSNGGQIALTVLEITGATYPTVLWAPVSKPFPYSILYYVDESEDGGKLIRRELAKFEETYDTDLYSIHKYFDRVLAPVQINQGINDTAVPKSWSDNLYKNLSARKQPSSEQTTDYFSYPGADHNLTPGWNLAITRNLEFFQKNLKSVLK